MTLGKRFHSLSNVWQYFFYILAFQLVLFFFYKLLEFLSGDFAISLLFLIGPLFLVVFSFFCGFYVCKKTNAPLKTVLTQSGVVLIVRIFSVCFDLLVRNTSVERLFGGGGLYFDLVVVALCILLIVCGVRGAIIHEQWSQKKKHRKK